MRRLLFTLTILSLSILSAPNLAQEESEEPTADDLIIMCTAALQLVGDTENAQWFSQFVKDQSDVVRTRNLLQLAIDLDAISMDEINAAISNCIEVRDGYKPPEDKL